MVKVETMASESGRKSALRRDFEREALPHLDSLYATALRLTRSGSDAEDLVQDSLLRAYRFYDRFEAGTNLRAWLLKIVTNTFINRYRKAKRERTLMESVDATAAGEGMMSRGAMRSLTSPVDAAQRRLIAQEIERALDRLPDEYRVMILLADVEELSYREIADVVGCPIGTVMSRLHRARKLLQQHLLDQAVQLGIVAPEDAAAEGSEAAEPVSLEAYRRKREVAP
jgi:RNA polymerase sigma-70 factor, ECF subfamily